MNKLLHYLNPIAHLGEQKYSTFFPLIVTIASAVLVELYVNFVLRNPEAVGLFAIFIFVALIIYFSFREGIKGGLITSTVTILYYLYIIYSQHYTGERLRSGLETTLIFAVTYFLVAGIIGWLKQKIDSLIEREANEKRRLQTIIQQLPVGIIITDNKGIVVEVNKKVESILGINIPLNFQIGSKVLLQSDINDKPVTCNNSPIMYVLTHGKSIVSKEYRVVRKDNKEIYTQVSASPIHNKDGKIIAAAEIITDVTEQKELEKRKDDFVNMASHELKTPITSMKLYIDLLMKYLKNYNDATSIKILDNIKNQTNKLQKLVNDLLDVSRLQTGKLSFSKENFKLDELIAEVIELLKGSSKHNIIFRNTNSITISADRFRIYQVITNLITNAIKYSPYTSDIIIKLKKQKGEVLISVMDFGIGVAKDQQKKIFERLYQVNDDKEKTFPGFGMGLYIAKEIIKRHKGRIWVESEKGKGSTFYVSLPTD